MADTPLGRGLIEIGANLAPLEKGLAEAQAKTRAALGSISGGVAGGASGAAGATGAAGSSTASATNAKQFAESMQRAAPATATVAVETKKVETATAGAAKQAKFFDVSISSLRSGGVLGGLTAAIGKAYQGFKQFGDSARQLGAELRAIESQFRSDINASLAPLSQRTQEIERARKAALDQLEAQQAERGIIADLVGWYTDEAELAVKIQKINQEADMAQKRNQEKAVEEAKKAVEEEKKKKQEATKAAQKLARDLYIQSLDERRQIEEKFSDDVEELYVKRKAAQTKAEYDAYTEALNNRKEIHANDIRQLDERKQKELEDQANITREKEKQQRDFMKAQAEQFGQLKSQINSLFNTGNMEVGINRVAGLIQVLIDKTERG